MAENRGLVFSLQDDPACHSLLVDRPPSRLSRVSSTSSRINREEMTNMNDGELDILCEQVFALCDTNGDGFITEDELIAQCGDDDPELFNQLMKTMDTNEDGKISLEEFRSGLEVVAKHLDLMQHHSTPNDKSHAAVYEHEPSMDEAEEAWLITMDKIDPAGYISNNIELRSVWMDLLTRDSNLLDKFEVFLTNVIEELGKSHSDIEQIEKRMKQLLTDHSKQASEMDGILDEQLRVACVQEQVKCNEKSSKLSDQYRDLLAERDELIASLADKEQTLQLRLTEKVHNEQELRKERLQLLHLNKSLQDQLSDSYRQLSASQLEIQRLSFHDRMGNSSGNGEDDRGGAYQLLDEPIVEMLSDCPVSDDQSLSSQNMIALSPPPDPPTQLSLQSPNLATEVAEALQQDRDDATPTLCHSFSTTPTDSEVDEKRKLLSSNEDDKDFVLVPNGGGRVDHCPPSSSRPTTITMATPTITTPVTIYQGQPSSTPVNMVYDPTSFTASTIIPLRQEYTPQPPLPTTINSTQLLPPSRVFKVVFLGDSGVGKTSLIHRLTNGSFITPQSTLGLDYNTCIVPVGEEKVVFQLWDTAGQERFQSTTAVYFKRADAFIIVYDVTSKNTFKSIKTWIALAKATLRSDLPVVMVMGNKTDKEQQRNVSKDEGRHLALELCAMFSETSALSGDNVVQAHTMLASLLLERENKDIEHIKQSALRLDKLQEKKKCKC